MVKNTFQTISDLLGGVNLALGKTTEEIDPFPRQGASKAVDGDYFTKALTNKVAWPYWYVDLEQPYMVGRVRLVVVHQGESRTKIR